MANKYLNQDGLLYLWQKIKGLLAGKVDKVEGMGLSSNDYTAADKAKLAAIEEGANKTIVNNTLTSTSTTEALAAAQGKVLDEKIKAVEDSLGELGYGDMMKATYDANGDGIVDNADKLGGHLPTYFATAAELQAANEEIAKKVEKVDGKGLSTNDLTNELKGQYDAAYAHSQVDHAPADAERNAIVTVSVNGAAVGADANRNVNIVMPTKVSEFTNDAGYLTAHQDISGKLDVDGNGSDVTATFMAASAREVPVSGEKLSVIFGKIAKYLADLKSVAFSGSYNDLTNLPEIPVVTNDLTNELKAQYDAAHAHAIAEHAPVNAQANVIEAVTVNGQAVACNDKCVDIIVPTTVAALSDAGDYALKADIVNVYKYKGSVANFEALPAEGNVAGDVYNTEDTGMNYAWTGSAWDNLGEIFAIEHISNAEIDAILAQ